jgi:hypothetical protein
MSCFGPPVYPYVDVDLPNFGVVSDSQLVTIVEAATTIYDQNHIDTTNAKEFSGNWEQNVANTWAHLISRQTRDSYAKAKLGENIWLRAVRQFLKANSDWGKFYHSSKTSPFPHGPVVGPSSWTQQLFDPINWHTYVNDFVFDNKTIWPQNGITDNPSQYATALASDTKKLLSFYTSSGDAFEKAFPWQASFGTDGTADISFPGPKPPPLEGFGITQFLEWLTGFNYFQLFAWEYSTILFITLISIAWTDFYPFFQEIGLING